MRAIPASIPEVMILEPEVHGDARGYFFESFNHRRFAELIGVGNAALGFVQDNQSRSQKNVLRGLHYQILQPQAKLVRVIAGEVFDVAVDLRRGSPTFGHWTGTLLSAENRRQLWIPEGFAHGFLVISEMAEVLYKTSDYWAPEYERCIRWDDPEIAVEWPLKDDPILSDKDRHGLPLMQAEVFA